MSEELGDKRKRGDCNKPASENMKFTKNYERFDGMNYEQVRQPFDLTTKNRNSTIDDDKDPGDRTMGNP